MNWKGYLPIIGILIFIYILIKIDIFAVIEEIKSANILYLLIALLLVLVMMVAQTFKWFVIAKKQKIQIPFYEALKINLVTDFYGFITPSKLGTVIRAEYLRKYSNLGKGMCNFVLDKVLDISSVFFIAIAFSFVFKDKIGLPINFFIAVFVLFIFTTLFFIKKERGKRVMRIFYKKFVPEKYKDKLKMTFDAFYEGMPKKRHFVLFFLLNLSNWFFVYSISFLIGRSLGINLSFVVFLAIFPIATLVSLIPISINGIGTREAILITLFSFFGISSAKVFSMSLISYILVGIVPAIIAVFLIFRRR